MCHFHYWLLFIYLILMSCSSSHYDKNLNIFRYNESSLITSLDPVFANNQANIWAVSQIFNTLVELDSNLTIQPSIAKKWTISDNYLKYTFIIRDDVYYHKSVCFGKDSTRLLRASDFIYSLSRLSDEKLVSPGSWVLDYINMNNVYAPSDTVLEINLEKPFPGLLGLLTMNYFSFVPVEAVEYFGTSFSSNPIGTGPFYFKFWKHNEKMILSKNNHYYEYDDNIRLPYLDGISISFITQKESVFMNFILGKFDFVSGLDNSFRDEFFDLNGELLPKYINQFSLLSHPYMNTEYLGINLPKSISDQSPLMSKYFRQALNYSFDRNIIAEYLRNGLVRPAFHGIVPNDLLNCYDVQGFFYSPDSVHQLLKKVPNNNKEIILHTTRDYVDICEYIQYSASNFGINIKIEISTPSVHRELVSLGESSFFRASWIADYPDPENFLSLFYSYNKSPSGPNYTHFYNRRYDSLYQESFHKPYLERCNLFSQMESILLEEAVIIPLYYDYAVRLVSNRVKGMTINSMNLLSLKRVQKEFD